MCDSFVSKSKALAKVTCPVEELIANLESPPEIEKVGLVKFETEEFKITVPVAIDSALLAESKFPLYPNVTSETLKVELRSLVIPLESVAMTFKL